MSDLDVLGLAPQPADVDPGMTVVVPVYAVDAVGYRVQVAVFGSVMWLQAMPGRYQLGSTVAGPAGLARVLVNPVTGRPDTVLGPLNPRPSEVAATLMTITEGTPSTATVSLDGDTYELPVLANVYADGDPVWVSLSDWGIPNLVLGPSDVAEAPVTPPAVPGGGGGSVQVVDQPVGAQWSGSYRTSRSAWDRWNTDRYGGRSTLYQGNGFGSGAMKGLATYGDQIVNLGASSIDRIRVRLRDVGLSGASGPATVQGSPHGSQPAGSPTSAGDTATDTDGWAELSGPTREAMRTGLVKGLCTVGANYWAVAGAGNGDGMTLLVTYTRPA